jgi:LysR substrate binding domain
MQDSTRPAECSVFRMPTSATPNLTQRLPVAMVSGSLAALRRLVANGHGVALLPRLSATEDLAGGALVELPPTISLAPIGIEARWRPDVDPAVTEQVRSLVALGRRNTLRAASTRAANGRRTGSPRGHGYDGRSARTLRRPASPLRPSPQENLL